MEMYNEFAKNEEAIRGSPPMTLGYARRCAEIGDEWWRRADQANTEVVRHGKLAEDN